MSAIVISGIVFACVFGGALAGMGLRAILPEHHRSGESKELVRAAMALIGTMSALVLGLLVGSAKSAYDAQKDELTSLSAGVLLVDQTLSLYGPETKEAREALREVVAGARDQIWRGVATMKRADSIYRAIHRLSPKDPEQQALKNQVSSLVADLAKTRLLMATQRSISISVPLLVMLVFWLTINFVSFGLFAHPNATVVTALFVCALSVSGAIFLIVEMSHPFGGLIEISDAPLRQVLTQLGR
jgi:hypothetical protein